MSRARRIAGLVALSVLLGGAVVAAVAPWERGRERGPRRAAVPARFEDFSRDPGWEGVRNRRLGRCVTTRQDFGAAGGGIAGLVTRNARPAWYGRRVSLGWERPWEAAGELVVRGTRAEPFPSGSVMVGAFNSANRDWRPPNLTAFQVNADTVEGGGDYSISLAYGARDYQQAHVAYGGDESPAGFFFGRWYRWRLAYDPRESGGRGTITLSIPQAGPPASLVLPASVRRAGADLNRLGVANQVMARGEGLEFALRRLRLNGAVQRPSASGAWEGRGNRASFRDCLTGQPNSFGWTGARDRRLGGLVARTDEGPLHTHAFYADRVSRLTMDDRLHAEGTVRLDRANTDSATLLGWFRARPGGGGREGEPQDFLGVAITGPSRIGQYFGAVVADRKGNVGPKSFSGIVLNPGPRTLRWSIDYDAAPRGGGTIVVRLGNRRVVQRIAHRIRRTGATFNRFGMRNLERGGSFQVAFFDDLRYTVGPAGPPAQRRR